MINKVPLMDMKIGLQKMELSTHPPVMNHLLKLEKKGVSMPAWYMMTLICI